jgi:hypothetical protein
VRFILASRVPRSARALTDAGFKQESQKHADEALLAFYIKEWDRYTTAAKFINHLFRYLNRHWVKREMDEGKKNIYDVYTVSTSFSKRILYGWLTAGSFTLCDGRWIFSTTSRSTLWTAYSSW